MINKSVTENTASPKVLLAITAHPDDETFGMGGTLALYARQGVSVHLVCATRGEVGEVRPEFMNGYKSVAELRTSELSCATKVLGLHEVHLLDYRDSGMPNAVDNSHPCALAAQPINKVADKLIDHIRRVKPQVMITFDPIGGYCHPDHIAIHRATVEAFHAAADAQRGTLPVWQPTKLYFHTMPNSYIRMAVRILPLFGKDPRAFGTNGDIDLTAIADTHFPTHAVVNTRHFRKVQEEASACHASQGGREMTRGFRALLNRFLSSRDTFMREYPKPLPGERIEKDLFLGL